MKISLKNMSIFNWSLWRIVMVRELYNSHDNLFSSLIVHSAVFPSHCYVSKVDNSYFPKYLFP
ncbi:hypothetical protein E2C01_021665 [Portunus trituberculatus]|uniref:Uncharacterized protein n=1 Tax=Portunus trituberculatus TaxID=210409 RepID=A0A5B7E4W4_PORTR|nr:hypothetical protein [Portunus trituberculatus]